MDEAISGVVTAEITTAIKDAKGNVGAIKQGQYIGILNGKDIEAVGDSVEVVATAILERMDAARYETMTILAGEDYPQDAAEELVSTLEDRYPEIEIDLLKGEQPLYPLILAVE